MLSTFRTAREAYLADLRISKSQKTYEQYELVLRKFGEWLEQTAAEQPQEQITPLTITACSRKRREAKHDYSLSHDTQIVFPLGYRKQILL